MTRSPQTSYTTINKRTKAWRFISALTRKGHERYNGSTQESEMFSMWAVYEIRSLGTTYEYAQGTASNV